MRSLDKSELKNEDEIYLWGQDAGLYEKFTTMERIDKIIELVHRYSFGNKILDVGCAQGNTSLLLAEKGFDSVALDLNNNFLNYARKKHERGSVSYVCANAMNMPFEYGEFDAVILGEIIEHAAYPEKILKEAKRCLKKNGLLIITTPNRHLFSGVLSGYRPPLYEKIGKKQKKEMKSRQFGPGGKDHLYVFNLKCLEKFTSSQKLSTIEKGYMGSCFINKFTYSVLRVFPGFFLRLVDKFLANFPGINKNFSIGVYTACRK